MQPRPLLLIHAVFLVAVVVSFGCGQRRTFKKRPLFPNPTRVRVAPNNFELWFKHEQNRDILIWIDSLQPQPTLVANRDGPTLVEHHGESQWIRVAYRVDGRIESLSPPLKLSWFKPDEIPLVTCQQMDAKALIQIDWRGLYKKSEGIVVELDDDETMTLAPPTTVYAAPKVSAVLVHYESKYYRGRVEKVRCFTAKQGLPL